MAADRSKRFAPVPGLGTGTVAIAYVCVDYLQHVRPTWHDWLMPALWALLVLATVYRIIFYRHWSKELPAALPFLASVVFLLLAFLFEALSVRFVTAVLGLDWHRSADPLPDTGQWLLLALNEKLPEALVTLLRAHIITLHHYLVIFVMLGFSVTFGSIKPPGLGFAARYIFTMAVGRLLRAFTFIATILPSPRPWCALVRYRIPNYPHPWAQKYYEPYTSDSDAISRLLQLDSAYAEAKEYPVEFVPDWGKMSFLANVLRPNVGEGSTWYQLLKRASGGCNDLMYSGHMLVAVLTAMAWTEAYGGWTSAILWVFVLHSAQREIRERHHYSVDCIVAIYVGILLWRATGFIWSAKDTSKARRAAKFDEVRTRLTQSAKDSDIDQIRKILEEVENAGQDKETLSKKAVILFGSCVVLFTFTCVVLALTLTTDG
ncbi:hypothetical protein LUZ63_004814 [Rhynchospora breviuscula]|uniref:Sphingomyelin synthase-like domain-containing protein n=1 Tax=Rhynchospora breviuscula TaxID=2022672 RepID=A0A9Q0CLQ0_9POAL|nr:hypothetical protein LUZ63_004814 [Rhynchospora breviuscula]